MRTVVVLLLMTLGGYAQYVLAARKGAEEALRESEERFRKIFDHSNDAIFVVDPAHDEILNVNTKACAILGYSREELLSMPMSAIHPDEMPQFRAFARSVMEHGSGWTNELACLTKTHQALPAEISASVAEIAGRTCMIALIRDISERKRAEEALREQARRDPLTGVLNHGAIVAELGKLLPNGGDGASHAVAMVDVDGLKTINDTYGHQMGDAVLVAVTQALSKDGALVGRYGGDEFVAVLPGADRTAAQQYRDDVLDTLAGADLIDSESGASVAVVASIGLAAYPQEAGTIAGLIRLEDSAMYASRRQRPMGPRTVELSEANASLKREISKRKRAEEALRKRTHDLGERTKELNCLYDISHLVENPGISLQEILQGVADLVPPAWQYPGITCGRVVLEGQEYRTANFRETIWKQASDVVVHGNRVGAVEVYYLEERPEIDEGSFLKEERSLITAIAELVGHITERKRAEEALGQAREESVILLAAAAEAHDHTTGIHLHRVRALTEALASELGYSEDHARELALAAVLHDIGKIRVPESVLTSTSKLSEKEWELMKHHTTWGAQFLADRPSFDLAATIARSHHERCDGSGYPDGLSGEAIPEAATIVAVADSFDAMTHDRPYKAGRSIDQAVREITACSGTQFSPRVVAALERLYQRNALPLAPAPAPDQEAAA